MIGVVASTADLSFAEEFFELFKTPWERAVEGRRYRVALTCGADEPVDADVVFAYGAVSHGGVTEGVQPSAHGDIVAQFAERDLPLYCEVARLGPATSSSLLRVAGGALDLRAPRDQRGRMVWRIGYNLFAEIRHLLTHGQPAKHAATPTLEQHIELLRTLLIHTGISFVEIPPRPYGSDFICCLTHDIDFFGIRRQGCDRTLAGFVLRASMGAILDWARRRRPFHHVRRNWAAVASLPLVSLGLAPDPWSPLEDYESADGARPSTFFLVPFKDHAGVDPSGVTHRGRAVRYQASEVRAEAASAALRGRELAVHGIDAWRDRHLGRREHDEITAISGRPTAGVRMHWLYFDAGSPRQLERAGYDYDSTFGYNDAVGYRAGTSQVFRWPETTLMELPLTIMDSAMFAPGRLGLTFSDAMSRCGEILETATRFGGVVVINWHCRSLAPERLWDDFYRDLLAQLQQGRSPWFATARDAVEWFRWRRAIRFHCDPQRSDDVDVIASRASEHAATVKVHRPHQLPADGLEEYRLDGAGPLTITFSQSANYHV